MATHIPEIAVKASAFITAALVPLMSFGASGTLTSFTVSHEACQSTVQWTVGIEFELSHFEIERSLNGFEFYSMDTVGVGNNVINSEYEYIDLNPEANSLVYYRLKLVYLDGDYIYTDLKVDYPECPILDPIRIAPNPVTSSDMNVLLRTRKKGEVTILLYDLLGRMVHSENVELTEGDNYVKLNIADLTTGHYKLVIPQTREQQAFIKD